MGYGIQLQYCTYRVSHIQRLQPQEGKIREILQAPFFPLTLCVHAPMCADFVLPDTSQKQLNVVGNWNKKIYNMIDAMHNVIKKRISEWK